MQKNVVANDMTSATTWWRRVDSNHRSETQQIYSLPPLATRELLQICTFMKEVWSWWTDSNPRPADYKSAALPAELHQRFKGACPTASAIILKESGIVKHEFQEKKKKERTEKRRKKSDRCIRRCGTSSSSRRWRSAPSAGWSSMGRTR